MIEVMVGVFGAALLGGVGWVIKLLFETREDVVEIRAQHQNNGGSTMKDAIERIDRKLDDVDDKLNGHLIQAASAAAKFDAHLAAHPPATVIVQQAPPTPPQQ